MNIFNLKQETIELTITSLLQKIPADLVDRAKKVITEAAVNSECTARIGNIKDKEDSNNLGYLFELLGFKVEFRNGRPWERNPAYDVLVDWWR